MNTNKNADVVKHGVEPRPVQVENSGQGRIGDHFLIWEDCLGKDIILLFSTREEAERYAKSRRLKDYVVCDF